jgi:hypothetical protein
MSGTGFVQLVKLTAFGVNFPLCFVCKKKMKTDLEILIEHLQSEYDYLKSSMDECIAEWDFDGAKAFRESVIFTKSKLNVLKCLENPNFKKINQISEMISRMEKSLTDRKFEMDYLDEQTRQRMEEHFNQSTKNRIIEYKTELEKLKSIEPKQRIDDDKILELLECLEQNKISAVEFEIIKDKIFLHLKVNNEQCELKFRTRENVKIEDYLIKSTKSILWNLGFNSETYKKQISNFNKLNKIKVLEELAIIYFEVFGIFGEERNIKIE